MLLYVTDSLDESERAELSAHLASGCPACAGALAASIGALLAAAAVWLPMRDKLNLIRAEQVQMVSLKGMEQPEAHGRVMWDKDHGMWNVEVFDLKPPPPGRTYELWFITPKDRKVEAGIFDVNARGRGSMMVSVPKDLGPITLAAITDEPAGGVDQPTKEGKIHLAGNVP